MIDTSQFKQAVITRATKVRDRHFHGNETEMARALGWKQPTLYRALRGATKTVEPYQRLQEAIQAYPLDSHNELERDLAAHDAKAFVESESTQKPVSPVSDGVPRTGRAIELRVLDITAGAGNGGIVLDERQRGTYIVDYSEIETLLLHRPRDPFTVLVYGDSMEPDFHPGDRVIVEPLPDGAFLTDGIYLIRVDEHVYLKQVEFRPGGLFVISSLNKRYSPFEVSTPTHDIAVLGRVWGKFKRY